MADNKWFANRGQTIQTVLAVLACSLSAFEAWPSMKTNELLSVGALLFYALVGLVFYSGIRLVNAMRTAPPHSRSDDQEDLLLIAIWEATRAHLRIYREIASQYPSESRSPLHSSSWPEWGKPWQHVHAALFAEALCFNRTRTLISQTFGTLGWTPDQPILRIQDSETMVGILSALEDFDYFLKSKVKVLGTGTTSR